MRYTNTIELQDTREGLWATVWQKDGSTKTYKVAFKPDATVDNSRQWFEDNFPGFTILEFK